MVFRVAVRAFNFKQYRTLSLPSCCSKRWYSGSAIDEKSSVTVTGKTIKYVRTGNGEHAVLCLPGALGSSWTDFKPQIEGLDHKTFTVIAWDPPGYGHSRPPNRDFSRGFLERDADDAVNLMRALDIPKFSVLGWSDGGITGIFLAAKYPEHLRKMAIWGANAYITDEEAEIYKKIRDVETWSERMKAPLVELYGYHDFRSMWEQWVDEFVRIHREEGGDICKTEVKSIKCPLLVLHGQKDPMVLSEHPKFIVDNVPGAQLHNFEDGKHNIHLRYSSEFNSLIQKFLAAELNTGTADHRYPVRLPPFWPNDPAVWFAQIEAQFHLSDITDDLTKYNCVLSQLDTKYAARLSDVVTNPPVVGKYQLLKTELINRLREDRLKKIIANAKVGQGKPSELLNFFRQLVKDEEGFSETLIRSSWLKRLPKDVRSIVETQESSLDSQAELADKIDEILKRKSSIELSSLERRLDVVSKQLIALTENKRTRSRSTAEKSSETSSQTVYTGNEPLYDATGLPVRGNRSAKDILKDINATSKYHSILTDFPEILYPSGKPKEVHRQTRHHILTKSGSFEPISPFRLSDDETRIAKEIIDSMMKEGTARQSNSSYGSALRVIRDEVSDGNGWYIFGDYRTLNGDTVSDSYRIRHPIEISDTLWGCNVFSSVSLRKDWTRIPMAPEDIEKTAVVTPFGKFEFPFMPVGLLNSTRTWQKVLDEVLQGLPYCFGYLDGILVFSQTHAEHQEHIRALFQRLSMNGIFVDPSSSMFGEPNVNFFHYLISGTGCAPIPEKTVKALYNMRPPKTCADVGRVLRMNNAYRRYVPASVDAPLRDLVEGSDVDFASTVTWSPELDRAFKESKSCLSRAALHSHPDPFAPLSISISVSSRAIGAVLNQKVLGSPLPLAFFSKALTQRLNSFDRYLYGMYESIKEFRPIVGGRDFSVLVDNERCVEILGEGRMVLPERFRYSSYSSQFTMDVQYVRACDNSAARCLAALLDVPSSETVETSSERSESNDDLAQHSSMI